MHGYGPASHSASHSQHHPPTGARKPYGYSERHGLGASRPNAHSGGQSKSRRLYVGNIPYHVGIGENGILQLFSALYVAGFRPLRPGEPLPVSSFWLHADGKFGFMELRGDAETVDIMQLNGLILHGRPLRVNRPSDYRPDLHGPVNMPPSKINVHAVQELCEKLGGIVALPAHLAALAAALPRPTPPPATENLQQAPKENEERQRNGVADARPESPSEKPTKPEHDAHTSSPSSHGLHSTSKEQSSSSPKESSDPVPERADGDDREVAHEPTTLEPHAAADGRRRDTTPQLRSRPAASDASLAGTSENEDKPTVPAKDTSDSATSHQRFVVRLRGFVPLEELDGPDDEYSELVEEIKEECMNYGEVVEILVPREGDSRGNAFVGYRKESDAKAAVETLRARVFNKNTIDATIVQGVSSVQQAADMA